MSKTKRISLIVKGKNILSDLIGIKERKIRRSVDAAIDKASEEKISSDEYALAAIERMCDLDSSAHLYQCINEYFDAKADSESWSKRVLWAEELKALLEQEVETPEEEK